MTSVDSHTEDSDRRARPLKQQHTLHKQSHPHAEMGSKFRVKVISQYQKLGFRQIEGPEF